MRALLARVYGLFRKDPGGVLDEEIQEHAAMLAAEYVRRGMSGGRGAICGIARHGQRHGDAAGVPGAERVSGD